VFEALLGRLARALADAGIPYMVIGGQAVLFYGEPRLTRDIDITLGVDADELPRLLEVCASTGLRALVPDAAAFAHETMVLPAVEQSTGIRVDFIFSSLPYERQAIERGQDRPLEGASVRYASAEDIIIHKLVAGRPRDIEDARAIIAKTPGTDRAYVTRWLREFDRALARELAPQFERLLDAFKPGQP
jgi:hypothetical protein